jgi:hypothetical protein
MAVEKAHVIEKRHSMQCKICMLIDVENKDMKWHLTKEGFSTDEDEYICDDCLNGIRDIRKKCHQKIDNPSHNIFANFMPWFAKDVPGLIEAFKKELF